MKIVFYCSNNFSNGECKIYHSRIENNFKIGKTTTKICFVIGKQIKFYFTLLRIIAFVWNLIPININL